MNYTMRCSKCGGTRLVVLQPDDLEKARELFFRKDVQDVILQCCGTWELHERTKEAVGATGTADMLQPGTPNISNGRAEERTAEGIRVIKKAVGEYSKGD